MDQKKTTTNDAATGEMTRRGVARSRRRMTARLAAVTLLVGSFVAASLAAGPAVATAPLDPPPPAEAANANAPVSLSTTAQDAAPVEPAPAPLPAPAPAAPLAPAPPAVGDQPVVAPGSPAKPTGGFFTGGVGADGKLSVELGKVRIVTTARRARKADILTPEVADVVPLGPSELLVTGKKLGSTQLIVWDEQDQSQVIDIGVQSDLAGLRAQLKEVFPDAAIEVSEANGQLALRGRVSTLQAADQAAQLAAPYSAKIVNLLEVSGGQQVMLQVKFAEVSKSATSSLGVNLGFTDGTSFVASNVGQVNPFGTGQLTSSLQKLTSGSPGAAVSVFGQGEFSGVAFQYFIQALRENNLLRILAEPNLIASSGQDASFLAGGEFPIPITQGGGASGGGTSVTVEFRQYGVQLHFTPVVTGNGKIRLKVSPEVSDLDFSTAVKFNGFVVPGLTSRKVTTTIELSEGQTFAIAGLLSNNMAANAQSLPGLGDLPVVGALFRSVRYQRKETELVVLVTPRLVEGMNPGQVTDVPGERWRDPKEADLFLNRDLGGEQEDHRHGPPATTTPGGGGGGGAAGTAAHAPDAPPAAFFGQYGFNPAAKPQPASASADDLK